MEKLANGLRMAEKAHAEYEKAGEWLKFSKAEKLEWPEFYAAWLINHVEEWSFKQPTCKDGSCGLHSHD